MNRSRTSRLRRLATGSTMATVVALAVAASAPADDWARDRAGTVALEQLDPAIRTAVAARSAAASLPSTPEIPGTPVQSDGFAWIDAGLGAAAGIGVVFLVLLCLTLVRHDGRLRSV